MEYILNEMSSMVWEIKNSQRSIKSYKQMLNPNDGEGYLIGVNLNQRSTFPTYFRRMFSANGHGTSKRFIHAVKKGRGAIWERIATEALNRLENGYKNAHGYNLPCDKFAELLKNLTSI
jgi:hypothetical protein